MAVTDKDGYEWRKVKGELWVCADGSIHSLWEPWRPYYAEDVYSISENADGNPIHDQHVWIVINNMPVGDRNEERVYWINQYGGCREDPPEEATEKDLKAQPGVDDRVLPEFPQPPDGVMAALHRF